MTPVHLPNLHLGVKTPRCPLCHETMVRELRVKRDCYVFACHGARCKVSIRVDDPFVGRWEDALNGEKIPCPNPRCPRAPDGEMRYFATRTGYMRAVCPECKATLTNGNPDRKPDDKTFTPEERGPVQ